MGPAVRLAGMGAVVWVVRLQVPGLHSATPMLHRHRPVNMNTCHAASAHGCHDTARVPQDVQGRTPM